ncbi:MAG: flagellar biosynthetic protein FliO [Porticoccaceae bacterium]
MKIFWRWTVMGVWVVASHGWAGVAPASPAPRVGSDLVSGPGLGQMTLGLVMTLALIFALAWAVRRFGRVQSLPADALRVLGGLSIGTRERVVLVKVGNTQLLLGIAPGRVQTLHVLAEPIESPGPSDAGAGARDFAERLQSVLRRGQS